MKPGETTSAPTTPRSRSRHAGAADLAAALGRHRSVLGEQRLVNLEWQLLPALGFRADAPSLHGALTEQPAFFAELVRYLYKRHTGEGAEEDDGLPADRSSAASSRPVRTRSCGPGGDAPPPGSTTDPTQRTCESGPTMRARPSRRTTGSDRATARSGRPSRGPRRTTTACLRRRRSGDLLESIRSDRLDKGLGLGTFTGAASRAAASMTAASRRATSPPGTAGPPTRPRCGRGPPGCCGASPTATNTTARGVEEEAEALRRGIDI